MNASPPQAQFRPNPQALALVVLAINGSVALFQREVLWWQWSSVGIVLLLGICHLFNRPFKVLPITLEFVLVLGLTIALMLSTGGTSSFFLAWLFILALYYPLRLPTPLAVWAPLFIGVIYLALIPFSPPAVPLAIAFARSLLLATVGWSIYDVARRLEHSHQEQKNALENLEQSQGYVHHLVETIPGITYIATQDGTLFMSPQVETLLGYSPQEFMTNQTFWDTCLHPDDYEAVMAQLTRKYEPGELLTCEYRLIAKDGRSVWFRDEAKVQRDAEGYVQELQGMMLEITQRKEDELLLSYQASLVNNMFDAVISTDKDYRIVSMNKAAQYLYRYTESEAKGKTLSELLRSDYPTTTKEDLLQNLMTYGFWSGEAVYTNKAGERLPILASVSKVYDKTGAYIGTVAIHKDMREVKQAQLAQQKSEHRYRDLLEQAAEGISVTDQHLQFILVNQALCDMLGYTKEELLQMKTTDLIYPENLERVPLQTDSILSGATIKSERPIRRKDGATILLEGNAKLLSDGTIQTILHDITERKRAEEKLQQTEAFYRAVAEKSTEGVIVMDKDFVVLYRHAPPAHLSNYLNAEMLGFNRSDLIHPQDFEAFLKKLSKLPPEHSLTHLFRVKNLAGAWDWFEGVVTNLLTNPAVRGYVVNYRNITERKQAEETIRQAEAFYRAMTEKSREGILVFDKDLTIQYHNPSHLQTKPNENASRQAIDLVNPKQMREFLKTLLPLEPGQTASGIFKMQTITGEWNWFESHVTQLLHDPSVKGYVVNYYLINERKYAEEARQELSQRLLSIQEEERRSIARELHDEIGQSLTAIRVNLQTAQHLRTFNPLEDTLQLTDMMLSQVRELSLNLHPQILEDLGLVAALRWYALQQAQRGGLEITFEIDLAKAVPQPELEMSLYRIAQEAITNILRHSHARHAHVRLESQCDTVRLYIKDDGQGFEVATNNPARKSLGLLSMRERAELHGGQFHIHSDLGQGTEVLVTLPINV